VYFFLQKSIVKNKVESENSSCNSICSVVSNIEKLKSNYFPFTPEFFSTIEMFHKYKKNIQQ